MFKNTPKIWTSFMDVSLIFLTLLVVNLFIMSHFKDYKSNAFCNH